MSYILCSSRLQRSSKAWTGIEGVDRAFHVDLNAPGEQIGVNAEEAYLQEELLEVHLDVGELDQLLVGQIPLQNVPEDHQYQAHRANCPL